MFFHGFEQEEGAGARSSWQDSWAKAPFGVKTTHNYREAEYVEVFVIFDLVGAGGFWNFAGGSSSSQIHPILACSGFERHHGEEQESGTRVL
jgi:hypothetical protein